MRILGRRRTVDDVEEATLIGHLRPSDERQAEIAMFRFLLNSMRKRHSWDRIKCALATGIPAFWILTIVLRPQIPAVLSNSFPTWLSAQVQPHLEETPAIWTIIISLAIAGFQWYNLAYCQRRVIPLVREMYERALTKRDPQLLTMLGEALRLRTLRESLRTCSGTCSRSPGRKSPNQRAVLALLGQRPGRLYRRHLDSDESFDSQFEDSASGSSHVEKGERVSEPGTHRRRQGVGFR